MNFFLRHGSSILACSQAHWAHLMPVVLLIDRDSNVRRTVEVLCEQWGLHCIVATKLFEGRQIYQSQSIDLIVVDLFHPEKSALAFINEVTSQERHPPVIGTFSPSKHDSYNVEQFARMLGVPYTLNKPLDRHLLHEAFQNLIPQVDGGRKCTSTFNAMIEERKDRSG
ncbi:MAG: response regulator [Nitrospirales bacterium]|nr:response regulator [Nitrospirales bacterium]